MNIDLNTVEDMQTITVSGLYTTNLSFQSYFDIRFVPDYIILKQVHVNNYSTATNLPYMYKIKTDLLSENSILITFNGITDNNFNVDIEYLNRSSSVITGTKTFSLYDIFDTPINNSANFGLIITLTFQFIKFKKPAKSAQ